MIARRTFVFALAAASASARGVGARAADLVKLRLGTTNSQSDAPFFIGIEKGYFREQGLDVETIAFDTAAKMIAPLGAGQLDVGGGNGSPALYNAIARGIELKIVANKASVPLGYGYSALVVRKSLYDSGKVRSVKDLRGLKIAEPAPSSNILAYALEKGGLTLHDVQPIVLGFPEMVPALENGSVDAINIVEPFLTRVLSGGIAVRLIGADQVFPNLTIASIIYGGPFMKSKPEAALKFMIAYLQAVRYYNDALRNGHIAGPNADDVVAILVKYLPLKDAALYRAITPNGVDPNGRVNLSGFRRDLAFYRSEGLLTGDVTPEQVIDPSYVEAALKTLGPYRAKKR
jgi:NitT/TauT family transport system substrate-binding protein